jgi:cytochrome c2
MKFFLLLLLSAVALADNQIDFQLHGKPVKKLTLDEVKKLSPPEEIAVWEPHEMQEVKYRAIPVAPLFDKVYGDAWKKVEEVLFTCSDGFQPSVEAARLQKYKGYFAIERIGQAFKVKKKQEGNVTVELGPFYLIWGNLQNSDLRVADLLNWPYQVIGADLVDAADRFPHMAPAKNASAAVKRGFKAFRAHCFACHAVNGDGGNKSIDLNRPVSVTAYWKEPWLKKWIMDPSQIRPGTVMPQLPFEGAEAEKVASDIVTYLKSMNDRKD